MMARGDRRLVNICKQKALGGLGQGDYAVLDRPAVDKLERQVAPIAPNETDGERDDHRSLAGLAGRRRNGLRKIEPIGFCSGIVAAGGYDLGRSGLRVPEPKFREN